MADIIIFGATEFAEVAWFYFTHDSEHDVVAFAVDAAYRDKDELMGIPVVDFESLNETHPPASHKMFVAMGYTNVNEQREEKYNAAKAAGYELVSYVCSRSVTWPGLEIGDNTFVFENNTIQPFTSLGSNVVVWSGNHLGHHGTIEDHVFITSHVVVSGNVRIGHHSFLGVNASIRDSIDIAERTVIGMGATVTRATEAGGVYLGSPAKKREPRAEKAV